MKNYLKQIILFLLFISFANAQSIDVNKLLKEAKESKKDLIVFNHIPGCPYCKSMLEENFKDENIKKELDKHFIYVDVYTKDKDLISFKDFKGTHREFSKHLGAFAYPATIFIDYNGKVIHKAIGYRNIGEYINELKYISSDSFEKVDLETFILNQELLEDE
jgi:thioredoxin-related protein